MSAAQVCDSTLDSSAQSALRKITRREKFEEPHRFNVSRAVESLRKSKRTDDCTIFPTEDGDTPDIQVNFDVRDEVPDWEKEGARNGETFYDAGALTRATKNGVDIFFTCHTADQKGGSGVVKGDLWSPAATTKEDHYRLVTILNSISRSLAGELGCGSETRLHKRVPQQAHG
ncbi:hypothetical protein [Streptomyces axinellae]|uniref:hypothetical protein n=1 Tax=Streptomyces axinellae TaxID=552788 RepID=UPI0031D62501